MTAGKNRVRLAVEPLEDRCTPSGMGGVLAALSPAQHGALHAEVAQVRAADGHAIPYQVVFRCSVDLDSLTVSSTGFATGGVGQWTALGQVDPDQVVIDKKADLGVYSGTGTMVTAKGDQLFYTFTTSWQLSTGKGYHLITATGGTGRFAGASGCSYSDCLITAGPTPQTYACISWGSGTLTLARR